MNAVPNDLVEYLHTMITPTHVSGESLVALDIEAIDWASIADGHYHGIIARGEPTEEQIDHMWRVIKPGAHVMLIAPESCPTGHKGACALEDKGFEIRDAILWVREAGRIHYVPKANGKERNAGCHELAKKRKGSPIYILEDDVDEEIVGEIQVALHEAGVLSDEVVNALQENGIPKDQIPKAFKQHFKKRSGDPGKYGNHHPTIKPKDVLARLLSDVAPGATVLDPFAGSGSMGLACLETGHNYIGIEREAEYVEIADARLHYWEASKHRAAPIEIVSEAPRDVSAAEEIDIFDLADL